MFKTINRDALIIYPKQPLADWSNAIFPDLSKKIIGEQGHDDATVYMLPEEGSVEDSLSYLKRNYKSIFENELFGWCEDEEFWPRPLTWAMFEKWFDYRIQSLVLDTVPGKIRTEEF